MTDCFALLDEPRRPWLDADALKQKFLALSATLHPDRLHNASEAEKRAAQQSFTELNSAYNCLREPRTRLQHLLELELGGQLEQVQAIPPKLMDVAMEVGRLCREADQFLAMKANTTSALLRVELFSQGHERSQQLLVLQKRLETGREEILKEIKAADARWVTSDAAARGSAMPRLQELCRLLSYSNRWTQQLQERIIQLSF
jgi:Fe-S protein assembly co-chaperone HscB